MPDGDEPALESPPPDAGAATSGGPDGDLPEAAVRRLQSTRSPRG